MCPGDAQAWLENKHKPLKSPTILYVRSDRSMQASCFPSAFLGERRSSILLLHTNPTYGREEWERVSYASAPPLLKYLLEKHLEDTE